MVKVTNNKNPTILIYRSLYPSSLSISLHHFQYILSLVFHHHHLLFSSHSFNHFYYSFDRKEIIKGCVTWLGAHLNIPSLLLQREGIDQNNLKFKFTGFPGKYMFHLLLFPSCIMFTYACIYMFLIVLTIKANKFLCM